MIKYLLKELEKSPAPVFSKKELVSVSQKDFEDLYKKKILVYWQPRKGEEERISSPRCPHGCALSVTQVENGYEAVCLEHPEEDPVSVEESQLSRYAFSIDELLFQVKAANNIEGDLHRVNGGFFYLGYKYFNSSRVGFTFISNIGGGELVKLSGLKHFCKEDDVLVILTPTSKIEDVSLKGRLRYDKITQTSLVSSMNHRTFELPIEKLIYGLVVTSAENGKSITGLTRRKKADYDKTKYLCYDKVTIPVIAPGQRSNVIVLNGNEVKLGDTGFLLFMRFVLELKRSKSGWVYTQDLETEGIITDSSKYQIYNHLRAALKGSLLNKDVSDFIESNSRKQYRISTHPDFVSYNRKDLLQHPDNRVRAIAQKLPKS